MLEVREIVKNLNKKTLSEGTNISYSRLRKFASSQIKELTKEEQENISQYLYELSCIIKETINE